MSLLDIFDAYKFPELKSNSLVRDLNLQFTWRYMKFLQVICTCDAAFLFVLQAVNATGVVRTWDVHTVNENMLLQKMHQKYILLSENRANIPTSIPDFCYSCEQWQIKKKTRREIIASCEARYWDLLQERNNHQVPRNRNRPKQSCSVWLPSTSINKKKLHAITLQRHHRSKRSTM